MHHVYKKIKNNPLHASAFWTKKPCNEGMESFQALQLKQKYVENDSKFKSELKYYKVELCYE